MALDTTRLACRQAHAPSHADAGSRRTSARPVNVPTRSAAWQPAPGQVENRPRLRIRLEPLRGAR